MEVQEYQATAGTEHNIASPQTENGDHTIHDQSSSLPGVVEALGAYDDIMQPNLSASAPVDDSTLSNRDETDTCCYNDDLSSTASPSDRFQMASKLIHLTLIMDKVAASEVRIQSPFAYFMKAVDSPFLSPFDHLNWIRVVHYIGSLYC
jgi:hypothetical protein